VTDLRERIEILEEENRQLRAMLVRPIPPCRGLENAPRSNLFLLGLFMQGGVWTRDAILDARQSGDLFPKTVDVLVHRLRKRLAALMPPVRIETQWGVGYYMDAENRALMKERLIG
jgi:hypothetical protein